MGTLACFARMTPVIYEFNNRMLSSLYTQLVENELHFAWPSVCIDSSGTSCWCNANWLIASILCLCVCVHDCVVAHHCEHWGHLINCPLGTLVLHRYGLRQGFKPGKEECSIQFMDLNGSQSIDRLPNIGRVCQHNSHWIAIFQVDFESVSNRRAPISAPNVWAVCPGALNILLRRRV